MGLLEPFIPDYLLEPMEISAMEFDLDTMAEVGDWEERYDRLYTQINRRRNAAGMWDKL